MNLATRRLRRDALANREAGVKKAAFNRPLQFSISVVKSFADRRNLRSLLRDDLLARAFENREQLLLGVIWNALQVHGRFQISDRGVKLGF